MQSLKILGQNSSITLLVLVLILGSLVISLKNPESNSKFIDLAQAGLGGYLAILVQSNRKSA